VTAPLTPPRPAFGDARPARDPALRLGPALWRGPRAVHVISAGGAAPSYELGPREHFVLSRLDGQATLTEIGAEYAEQFGRRLGDAAWGQLLGLFGGRGLLDAGPNRRRPAQPPRPSSSAETPPEQRFRGLATARLADPSALLDKLHRRLRWLCTPYALVPLTVLVLALLVLVGTHLPLLWAQAGSLRTHPELIVFDVGLLWLSSGLHELAHGLAARHFGGGAAEIGMRWGLAFYCQVQDVLLVPARRRRVLVAAIGVPAGLVFLLPFAVLWLVLPAGDPTRGAFAGLLLVGCARAIMNYLPLPNLDGYVMVCHALNVLDLAAESRRYLYLLLARGLRRGAGPVGYPAWLRAGYLGYLVVGTAVVGAVGWLGGWLITAAAGSTGLIVLGAGVLALAAVFLLRVWGVRRVTGPLGRRPSGETEMGMR
jgi:putative peptide zinc metalloprotease protein